MDALLSVADAQADPEDYYLDLNASADAGMEEFDFKLDGAYDDEAPAEADPESAAEKTIADFEISYEDEEAAREPMEDDPKDADENAEGVEDDAGQDVDVGYQDEIGYEDEEPDSNADAAGSDAAGSATDTAEAGPGMPSGAEVGLPDDENYEFDDPDEGDMSMFNAAEPSIEQSADTTDGASTHRSQHDQAQTPASGLGDHQETPAGFSGTSLASDVPEITVHYNQGQYSLIGAPSDDPDSYFLSDVKELDAPLSQLLASIRAVISDEVSPGDELLVRIDALDLEFGEKSNQKFLDRSFHDILRCYSALFSTSPDDPHELEFDLLMRRDCEERFLELLREVGLAGEQPDRSADVDEGEISVTEEASVDAYSENLGTGEGLATAADSNTSETIEEVRKPTEPQAAPETGDDVMSEAHNLHADLTGIKAEGLAELEMGGERMFEEEYQQELQHESSNVAGNTDGREVEAPDTLDVGGDLDEAFTAGEMFYEQELAIDLTEQSLEQGVDEWSGEASGQADIGVGEVLVPNDIGSASMLEPTLHDNDISLTFGAPSALTTIQEQGDIGDDMLVQEERYAAISGPFADNSAPAATTIGDAQEVKSRQTSRTSTVNGDEIGYEENNQAGVGSKHGSEQHLDPLGDEIDWNNDGEEDGERETTVLAPSGKRDRTNEPEGLSDGTDNKRRRT